MKKKEKNSSIKEFSDRMAYNYFVKMAKQFPSYANLEPHEKMHKIQRIKYRVLAFSALYGALGVLFLYIPQYIFPHLFPESDYRIFFSEIKIRLSLSNLIYGLFLTALEIWLLAMTDIRSVGRIAAVYGYPQRTAKATKEETESLIDIGMGKDNKLHIEVGINPLQNTAKAGVYILLVFFRIKAILSKFVFRFLLKKVLGRLAVRSVLDMAGIPIYAFWNAYAAAVVIRKAHMRMYAHNLMLTAGDWFYDRYSNNEDFKNLIYDNLQYVAIVKKSFYPTDYLFAKHFLLLFDISLVKEHKLSKDYFDNLKKLSPELKSAVAKFLVIGFLTDGKLGSLEIRGLKNLYEEGIIPYDILQIKIWTKKYIQGYGFDEMLNINTEAE